jgi:hypothetical protein
MVIVSGNSPSCIVYQRGIARAGLYWRFRRPTQPGLSKRVDAPTKANQAARLLAKRSVKARRARWGDEGFARRIREWGKLGGRPRKDNCDGKRNEQ